MLSIGKRKSSSHWSFSFIERRRYLVQATEEVHSISHILEAVFIFYRNFVAEFGEDAFFDYYLAQLQLLAVDHLPGISHQYRKAVVNATEAHTHKERNGDAKKKQAKKE